MTFSPPPLAQNGKRKRPQSSTPSSEPPRKRERADAPPATRTSVAMGSGISDEQTITKVNAESTQPSIHPRLPTAISKLHLHQRPAIHDLTVISSSKIHAKVTQVLDFLRPPRIVVNPRIQDGKAAPPVDGSNQEDAKDVVVRISAKSAVASKAITVAEIVKREIRSQRRSSSDISDERKKQLDAKVYQYNQVHGVRLPKRQASDAITPRRKVGKKAEVLEIGHAPFRSEKQHVVDASLDGVGNASVDELNYRAADTVSQQLISAQIETEPSKSRKPISIRGAKGKKTYTDADGYLVTREITSEDEDEDDAPEEEVPAANTYSDNAHKPKATTEDEEADTSLVTIPGSGKLPDASTGSSARQPIFVAPAKDPALNEPNASDEDDAAFGTIISPKARARERERLALIAELRDDAAAKQLRAEERPTAVLTIYLCTTRIRDMTDDFGEEVV